MVTECQAREDYSLRAPPGDTKVNNTQLLSWRNRQCGKRSRLPFFFPKALKHPACASQIHLVLTPSTDIWQNKFYWVLFESFLSVSIAGGLISIINRVFPWHIQNDILRTAVLRYAGPILYSALQALSSESDPVKSRMHVFLVTHWSNLSSKFCVPLERVGDIKSI